VKLRFFAIPVLGPDDAAATLNQFLAAHRILEVRREFVTDGLNSHWAICVAFDDAQTHAGRADPTGSRKGKVDYREQFSDPEFAVFARLRGLRKTVADEEGVPAFTLFTNEQLAEMVRRRVTSITALGAIAGVGEARTQKYGKAFVAVLTDAALPPPERAGPAEDPGGDHEI
jgi:superfamily II DNA helicase RecQ